MKYLIFISLYALFSFVARAQKITFNETQTDNTILVHKTIATTSGSYVDVQFDDGKRDKKTTITLYSDKLQQRSSKDVEALNGKTFEDGFGIGDKVFLYYTTDHKQGAFYELNAQDGSVKPTGANFDLDGEYAEKFFGASPDGSHIYLLMQYAEKGQTFSYKGVVVDRQLHVISKLALTETDGKRIEGREFSLSNEGVFNLITNRSVKNKEADPNEFTVTQVDAKGHNTTVVMPAGIRKLISCQASGNKLHFTGLSGEAKSKYNNTLVTGVYDVAGKKVEGTKQIALPEDDLEATAAPIASFMTKDGGQLIVLETSRDESGSNVYDMRKVATGSTDPGKPAFDDKMVRASSPSAPYFYFDDLYVFKLNAQQGIEWQQKITKRQILSPFKRYGGTAVHKSSDDGLQLFFMDDRKNVDVNAVTTVEITVPEKKDEHGIACVTATKDGKFDKVFLGKPGEYNTDYSVEFDGVVQDGGNKISLIASKIKMIRKIYYHLATITIE